MTSAGKHGVGILSIASYSEEGLTAVTTQWGYAEEAAKQASKPPPDRGTWRLVVPFHLSETREQAIDDISDGIMRWNNEYLVGTLGSLQRKPVESGRQLAEAMNKFGGAIIGTPDDAIACIHRLQEISGGFGTLLGLAHEWTTQEKLYHSYELMARYVVPEFQGTTSWLKRSEGWTKANRERLMGDTVQAITKAIQEHAGQGEGGVS
jgi:limonene 1,2-monooxygenase